MANLVVVKLAAKVADAVENGQIDEAYNLLDLAALVSNYVEGTYEVIHLMKAVMAAYNLGLIKDDQELLNKRFDENVKLMVGKIELLVTDF